jgi:hypothetical protein
MRRGSSANIVGDKIQWMGFHIRLAQEFDCVLIHAVCDVVDQARDTGVDECLGAVDAGKMGHITPAAVGGNAVQGGLDDGICLGMDGADAVAVHQQVAHFVTVGLCCGRAVEPGGKDALIAHQHTADKSPVAGAALGHRISNFHKVRIPIGPHGFISPFGGNDSIEWAIQQRDGKDFAILCFIKTRA